MKRVHVIGLASALLVSGLASAGETGEWTWDGAVWLAASSRSLVESSANPDNRVLYVPEREARFEVRPDLKFSFAEQTMILRPRGIIEKSRADAGRDVNQSRVEWSDAYLALTPSDKLQVTYGLQNYQWGPAEAAGPSNRIFRETIQARDLLYVVKGRHLLRFNYSPSGNWTEVLMAELSDNGDPELTAEEAFEKKALLKSEFSGEGGAHYFGVVVGGRERSGAWIGEYFNFEIVEGLTFYLDASHERGTRAWYPRANPSTGIVEFSKAREHDERVFTFLVSGLRYAFVNGSDVRGEFIFNEAGYSSPELNATWAALTSTSFAQRFTTAMNSARIRASGVEFPGQRYFLLSLRIPEPWNVRDWQVYFRDLVSLDDGSTSAYVTSEWAIGDRGTLLGALGWTSGAPESELRGTVSLAGSVAYRYTW